MKYLSLVFWLVVLVGAGYVYQNDNIRASATEAITDISKSIDTAIPQLAEKNLITTKQTQTTEESDTAKQTPLESNITAGTLAKTYYYHFDNNVPERVRTVFEQAVAKYNATGIVKLVPGQGTKKQNQIRFFVYQKTMSEEQQGAVELGHGGPQIIQQYGFGAYTANHARSGLNVEYLQSVKLSVAMHELGHAVGLGHSDQKSSLMYPIDQGLTSLAAADIAALKTIYQTKGN
ncbi:peptidase [Secundilactobacillus oryzae JCM 18671]|uniref:Peptidase n=2 Tax=Secundilactobacillus oryzae TaxID=1202668 RepID=A0A081BII2_9LACO|nr:M57 family metalloprotease [Secundilactobacillus oryzae]GAK47850.1 peptidase [Secundilactobacillus oryzae JCM 18671]